MDDYISNRDANSITVEPSRLESSILNTNLITSPSDHINDIQIHFAITYLDNIALALLPIAIQDQYRSQPYSSLNPDNSINMDRHPMSNTFFNDTTNNDDILWMVYQRSRSLMHGNNLLSTPTHMEPLPTYMSCDHNCSHTRSYYPE